MRYSDVPKHDEYEYPVSLGPAEDTKRNGFERRWYYRIARSHCGVAYADTEEEVRALVLRRYPRAALQPLRVWREGTREPGSAPLSPAGAG